MGPVIQLHHLTPACRDSFGSLILALVSLALTRQPAAGKTRAAQASEDVGVLLHDRPDQTADPQTAWRGDVPEGEHPIGEGCLDEARCLPRRSSEAAKAEATEVGPPPRVYSGDMGNSFEPNRLSIGSSLQVSSSK